MQSLQDAVDKITKRYVGAGYTYETVDSEQNNSTVLLQDKHIKISTIGCDKTYWGRDLNILLRFWHDCVHVTTGRGFSFLDELAVIENQIGQLKEAQVCVTEVEAFRLDMYGQAWYYEVHREYVKDQLLFVEDARTHGLHNVVDLEY